MRTLKDQLPLFFDRYTDIALAYGYLRERIVNNNSLSSFNLTVKHFTESLDIEEIFHDRAFHNEKELANEKGRAPSILSPITKFMTISDS